MLKNLIKLSEGLEVLYVEDNEDARDSTVRILQRFMKNLRVAEDGQEGLDIFTDRTEYIDLVITDISMPIMNGLEMIKNIKMINQDIHTVVISAHNDTGNLVNAIELGVEHFLIKPIEPTKMLNTLEKVLTKIQEKKELQKLQQKAINDRLWSALDITNTQFLSHIALPAIIIDEDDNILHYNSKFCSCVEDIENNELYEALVQNNLNLQNLFKDKTLQENSFIDWKEEAIEMHEGILDRLEFYCSQDDKEYGISIKRSTFCDEQNPQYILIFF